MRCCVPFCEESNENIQLQTKPKSQQVTFHKFPNAPEIKKSWLRYIGAAEGSLPDEAEICSKHFQPHNFYVTRGGLIRLRKNAVPTMSTLRSDPEPSSVEFCMICLDTECKLKPCDAYLKMAYNNIIGSQTGFSNELQSDVIKLCTECAQRLANCYKFRHKCLKSQALLSQLVKHHGKLTLNNIKSINRVIFKLKSPLVKHTINSDHFELTLNENTEKDITIEHIEIKDEINDCIMEYETERISGLHNSGGFTQGVNDIQAARIEETDSMKIRITNIKGGITVEEEFANASTKNPELVQNINVNIEMQAPNLKGLLINDKYSDLENGDVIVINDGESANEKIIIDDKDDSECLNNDRDCNYDYDMDDLDDDGSGIEFINNSKKNPPSPQKRKSHRKQPSKVTLENIIFVKDSNPYIQHKVDNYQKDSQTKPAASNDIVENDIKKLVHYMHTSEKSSTNLTTSGKSNPNNTDSNRNDVTIAVDDDDDDDDYGNALPKGDVNFNHENYTISVTQNDNDLKLFKAIALSTEEQMTDLRNKKECKRYKRSKFACNMCFKGYKNIDAYKRHMDRHTDKYGTMVCPVCKIRMKYPSTLWSHIINNHAMKYSCTVCSYVTCSRFFARQHENWHCGKKFKCPHCQLEFTKQRSYFVHVRLKHPSNFVCVHCGSSFPSRRGLLYHMTQMHSSGVSGQASHEASTSAAAGATPSPAAGAIGCTDPIALPPEV